MLILYVFSMLLLMGCGGKDTVTDYAAYESLKTQIEKLKSDFSSGAMGEASYAKKLIKSAKTISRSKTIPPMTRYSQSMKLYREALKFDADNKTVKDELKRLKEIYSVAQK